MSEPLGSGAKSVGKVTVALSSSTTTLIARLALPPPLDVSNSITCALAPATRANDALARHARTRSLVHIGWQQDAGATREIRLRGERTVKVNDPAHAASAENPELDGDISLRFGRGVEVHLDALLRLETRDSAGRPAGQQRFRLSSKRILNYGELHYLDHPALGAIVRVDQVEAGQ